MRRCGECRQTRDASEFLWTYDRYGNPWRRVCYGCAEQVQVEISKWRFDPADAGERLEPDD